MYQLTDMIACCVSKLHEENVVVEEFLNRRKKDYVQKETCLFLKSLLLESYPSRDIVQEIEYTFLSSLRSQSSRSDHCVTCDSTPHQQKKIQAHYVIIPPLDECSGSLQQASASRLNNLNNFQVKPSFNSTVMLEGDFPRSYRNVFGTPQQRVEKYLEIHNYNQGRHGVTDKYSLNQGVQKETTKQTVVSSQLLELKYQRKESRGLDDIWEQVGQLVLQEAELRPALSFLKSMPKRHEVNLLQKMLSLIDLHLLDIILFGPVDTHLPISMPQQVCARPSVSNILRILLPKPVKLQGLPGKLEQITSDLLQLENYQYRKGTTTPEGDEVPFKGEGEEGTQYVGCSKPQLEVRKAVRPSDSERLMSPNESKDMLATCPSTEGGTHMPKKRDLKSSSIESQFPLCEATLRKILISTSVLMTVDSNLHTKLVHLEKTPARHNLPHLIESITIKEDRACRNSILSLKQSDFGHLETATNIDLKLNAVSNVSRLHETLMSSQSAPKELLQVPSPTRFNVLWLDHLNMLLEISLLRMIIQQFGS
ncbi:hypothetical protein R1sor_027595 [Riccia sorocarpa]|uniref:Uncharacterized protein n=1 Tax=Riccia sorocarpa TaxID=122646 RepID=A0ABD3GHI9_9MARC